jgi:hypothetical protein
MVDAEKRRQALDLIKRNIAQHGHHIYVVQQSSIPRFAYTIGLRELFGAELILAGAILYFKDDVVAIINRIAAELRSRRARESSTFAIGTHGLFELRKVDASWVKMLMLGALDYYQVEEVPAFQIVPDTAHQTTDVPNMGKTWSATGAPAWKWLHDPWTFPVPASSTTTTNLGALRGEHITEAARWEEDEWEIFAGSGTDVPEEEMRVVPLGTLLATDGSLAPVVNLAVGEGLWRDEVSEWQDWSGPEC